MRGSSGVSSDGGLAMTPYSAVACFVALVLLTKLPDQDFRRFTGSLMIAIIWPVLIPIFLYFGVKHWILRYPFRSDWVLTAELTGCVLVTAVAYVSVL